MPLTYTRSEIRSGVLDLIDRTNTTPHTTAVLNERIDVWNARLGELLMDAGLGYFALGTAIEQTMNGTVATIPLDATNWRVLDVCQKVSTEYWPLPMITPAETTDRAVSDDVSSAWYIDGSNVVMVPLPASGKIYRVRWYPVRAKLAADASTIDGVSGWEDYIRFGVASDFCAKEQRFEDAKYWLGRAGEVEASIRSRATKRVMQRPGRIRDVDHLEMRPFPRDPNDRWPWGGF